MGEKKLCQCLLIFTSCLDNNPTYIVISTIVIIIDLCELKDQSIPKTNFDNNPTYIVISANHH